MPKEMHVPRTHRTDSIGYSRALWYSVDCVVSRTVPSICTRVWSDPLFPPPDHGRIFLYLTQAIVVQRETETEKVSPEV